MISRRDFLAAVTGGIVVLIADEELLAQETGGVVRGRNAAPADVSAWLHVAEDGSITGYTGKVEVGQNARTSLTQAIAEELRAPVTSIRMVMGDTALTPFDQGTVAQRQGVKPDILLPNPNGYIDSGESSLEHALPFVHIDPAPHDDWHLTAKIPDLVAKSGARVAKDPVLSKIANAVAVLKSRKEDTKVPLATKAWEDRRKQQKAELDAASPDLEKATPRLTVTTVEDTPVPAPGPGGKADDRLAKWKDALARDPWVDEAVSILADWK